VYGAKKDFKKAEGALNKAIELQPAWMAPLANVAQLYVIQGQTGAAIKRLDDALKNKPDNMTIRLLLGQLYHKSKEYAKAVSMYEKVLEKQPANWAVANDLAFLLAEQGNSGKQLDRARDLAQKALAARPNEPSIEDTLGWVYYKQGDTNRALELIEKAYAQMASSPTINYHMGMVLYKAGRLAEAKDYLAKAVKSGETFDGKEEAQGTLGKL
jgi:Flp pilus assembly protein TadD